eukprot:6785782-Alexandrium_andersonii.AAC.1
MCIRDSFPDGSCFPAGAGSPKTLMGFPNPLPPPPPPTSSEPAPLRGLPRVPSGTRAMGGGPGGRSSGARSLPLGRASGRSDCALSDVAAWESQR